MRIEHLRRRVRLAAATTWLALLAACGGGAGGTPERLVVTMTFPAELGTAEVRQPLSVMPQLSGLNGHRPHCSLSAGGLPPGMSMADDCGIAGTPSQGGNFSFTVHLTADGVTGALDFPWSISVFDPTPLLHVDHYSQGLEMIGADIDQSMPVGASFYQHSLVSFNRALDPAETLVFTLQGVLPTGLSFDPATGTLGGTVTQTGQFDLRVGARLLRRGQTFEAAVVPLRLYISPPAATASWGGCGLSWDNSATAPWLSAVQCTLSVQDLQPGDHWALVNLSTSGDLSYDESTHRLSVAALPADGAGLAADLQVTLADGVAYRINNQVTLRAALPRPNWDDGSGLFTNLAGVLKGPGAEPRIDVFSGTVRVQAKQAIALDPVNVTDHEPGDIHRYALQAVPGQSLPAWLSINPATGRLSGTPPALAQGEEQDVEVTLTTTRNGQQGSTHYRWRFYGPL